MSSETQDIGVSLGGGSAFLLIVATGREARFSIEGIFFSREDADKNIEQRRREWNEFKDTPGAALFLPHLPHVQVLLLLEVQIVRATEIR